MKILFTSYRSLGYGGAEVSTLSLAKHMIKLGHEVIIASTQEFPGIRTIKFKEFHKIPFFQYHENYLSKFLCNLIQKEKIDIVHANDRLTAIPAILAAKKCQVPVVAHFRDYWYACPRSSCCTPDGENYNVCTYEIILKHFPIWRWLWELYKWSYTKSRWKILESADAKIVRSMLEKEKLSLCQIKTNVHKIPISRDPADFDAQVDVKQVKCELGLREKVVAFIGSLFYTKGILEIIDIMEPILESNPSVSFAIVGDGPLLPEIKKRIEAKGLENSIKLIGRVPYKTMPQIYKISDIIVLPSIWQEPFSGIPLEAAASERVVIASSVGGFRDQKDLCQMVEPRDSVAWRNAIIRLLNDEYLRKKLARQSKMNFYKNYSNEVVAQKIEELYKTLTSQSVKGLRK